MRSALLFVCIYFFSFLFPSHTEAARNLTIVSDKTTLSGEDEMVVTASASGFTNGEPIFIKGAFVQSGTSNYFGYTKFNDAWIKNSASIASQKSVTIGMWDGTLTVRSDVADSGYKGEGEYIFKVGFYTGSGSSVTWSTNAVTVSIHEPDPTNTPIPTNTIQPSNTPTSTPTSSPLAGVTAVISLTPTPTSTKSSSAPVTPTIRHASVSTELISGAAILGVEVQEPISQTSVSGQPLKTKSVAIALLLVSIGVGLFAIASVLTKTELWNTKNKI